MTPRMKDASVSRGARPPELMLRCVVVRPRTAHPPPPSLTSLIRKGGGTPQVAALRSSTDRHLGLHSQPV